MSRESVYKNDNNSDSDSESDDNQRAGSATIGLDLGDDCVHKVKGRRLELPVQSTSGNSESASATREKSSRREDNPFSFKHFLRDSNTTKNYQSLGARPKVYRDSKPKNDALPDAQQKPIQNARNSEFSSALPDFVQDHLVMEQCYLGNRTCSNPYDLDLPDFATNHVNGSSNPRSSPAGDPIPLDLPGLPIGDSFPLDLPLSSNVTVDSSRPVTVSEVGNSQSLPDFLTDGPVRPGNDTAPFSPPDPLCNIIRSEQCRRCSELHSELAAARQRVLSLQNEADQNHRKASLSESNVHRLKQEVKYLKEQLNQLKTENQLLKLNEGAVGGGTQSWKSQAELPSNGLAQELRTLASTAEHYLRQLLTGVDNLRMTASTLENMHRIEEKRDRFSNFDDNTGPAL